MKSKTSTSYFDSYQLYNGEAVTEIRKALNKIGVYVYTSPIVEGQGGTFGFIFSNKPLTKTQVNNIEHKALGIDDNEDD